MFKVMLFSSLFFLAGIPFSLSAAGDPAPLPGFRPLPDADPEFSAQVESLVKAAGLDEMTPKEKNPDEEDEWCSICVVDLSIPGSPRLGGWKADNFIYPASSYKLYVLGEAIRRVVSGSIGLDDIRKVREHNVRTESRLSAGQEVSVSEILRLMMQYSDNTAANEAIDLVNRERASEMLRAIGCSGSEITRKYLPRSLEDDGYTTAPGTTSCARHFAQFLWAVEQGALGGGRGRGLIRAYMAMDETAPERFAAGLPSSATIYSKTGTWDIFTSQAAIIEDGPVRCIVCVLTPYAADAAEPRMAHFIRDLHALLMKKASGSR